MFRLGPDDEVNTLPLLRLIAPRRNHGSTKSKARVLRGEHGVGPMSYGVAMTENYLFASTEPGNTRLFNGVHGYVHVRNLGDSNPILNYWDLNDAGDATCVHPDG
jgi:hypothetical protein